MGRCNDFAPSRQKNCHRQKQPSRPGLRKKKNTASSRPVEKKKKPPRPASEKKKKRPSVPPRKKTTTAPSRLKKTNKPPRPAMNSKIHRLEGGNWKQIPPPVTWASTLATSCQAERNFSALSALLGDLQSNLGRRKVEMMMLLKLNQPAADPGASGCSSAGGGPKGRNCCWQRCISVIVYWLSLTVRVLLAMYWHFRGGRY